MRVFVTGASGWIGSAVVRDLLAHGHEVTGLARSDASAAKIAEAGAEVVRGSLEDLDGLRSAAAAADGVAHLGYVHDFSSMEAFMQSAETDRTAIRAMAEAMAGTDKPLVITAGTAASPGTVLTEETPLPAEGHPRIQNERLSHEWGRELGVRTAVVRCAPTVHGEGDQGFIPMLLNVARERGVAAYIGEGENAWNAVHRDDAAKLYRLALEQAPAGTALHAVAEEAVTTRAIAGAFARGLGVEAVSIAPEAAVEHFGMMGTFFALDLRASSALTRERFGWEPTGPTLLEDLEAGHYF